eukprot:353453-Chlamydomonas_euryale.AAC.5
MDSSKPPGPVPHPPCPHMACKASRLHPHRPYIPSSLPSCTLSERNPLLYRVPLEHLLDVWSHAPKPAPAGHGHAQLQAPRREPMCAFDKQRHHACSGGMLLAQACMLKRAPQHSSAGGSTQLSSTWLRKTSSNAQIAMPQCQPTAGKPAPAAQALPAAGKRSCSSRHTAAQRKAAA